MNKDTKNLYNAILKLKSIEECKRFFDDLCTPKEIEAMVERWEVCKLLARGDLSYRDIHDHTGVSLATIVRVARFLNNEKNDGYKLILERMKEE